MDTKWRKYRYSGWLKLAAVILCLAGMLIAAYGCMKAPGFSAVTQNRNFKDSTVSIRPLENLYSQVYQAAFEYRNPENIQTGAGVSEEQLNRENGRIYDERNQAIQEITSQYESWLESARTAGNTTESIRLEKERDERIARENAAYSEKQANLRNQLIQEQQVNFSFLLKELKKTDGLYYTVLYPDGKVFSNKMELTDANQFYSKLPIFRVIGPEGVKGFTIEKMPQDSSVVYVGMSQEWFDRESRAFEATYEQGRIGIYQMIAGLILFLIGVIYFIYAAGKRRDSDEVHLIWIDGPYLDIELAVVIPAITLAVFAVYALWDNQYPVNQELFYVVASLLVVLATLVGIAAGTSIVKRLKRRECFRHTLVGAVILWVPAWIGKVGESLGSGLKKGPLSVRAATLFGGFAGAVFLAVLLTAVLASGMGFFGVLIGACVYLGLHLTALKFVLKKVGSLKEITQGAERIRAGELAFRISKTGEPETDALVENINQIAEGLKASVEKEVKAERLKAELVTNVSHDLKTPLTAIITYVDLLKTEGVCSENAPRYLEVLDQKSQRLRALTEDLFEAAKASSGTTAFSLEKLDITDLISQGLGELSDTIKESGLDFKVNAPAGKVYALGDGKLLWRVMENMLSNVFKYAQPGSRVYIDTICRDRQVLITLKNISAFELNIQPEELMERFKRGDESRSSEGSGLGLSIARSLTELQGGSFRIAIDGDLFKATVAMPECAD